MRSVKVFGGLFMMLALSSFVFAASSEITTDFAVDVIKKPVVNYVPVESSTNYFGYLILAVIAIALVYFIVKNKKVTKKKVVKKVVAKKKKVVKKITAKKKVAKKKKVVKKSKK